ncbi:hypothetical protein chiPu_0020917, partial [Chiloscyllium punctatum]|nr:hypothetical protein [Chiloscyllium punctatum]
QRLNVTIPPREQDSAHLGKIPSTEADSMGDKSGTRINARMPHLKP